MKLFQGLFGGGGRSSYNFYALSRDWAPGLPDELPRGGQFGSCPDNKRFKRVLFETRGTLGRHQRRLGGESRCKNATGRGEKGSLQFAVESLQSQPLNSH